MASSDSTFEAEFVPALKRYAMRAFSRYADRTDRIADAVSVGWEFYRVAKVPLAPYGLAVFAVRAVKDGRQFPRTIRSLDGCPSKTASKPVRVVVIVEALASVGDDPAELAAVRLDWADWSDRVLTADQRRAMLAMLAGERTDDLARQLGLSAGRISQLRKELVASWVRFTE